MSTIPLRRAASVLNGGTPTSDSANWNGGVPWATPIDLARIDGKSIADTDRTLTEAGVRTGSTMLPRDSVLVSSRAPIGYTALNTVSMAFNQGCKGIVPRQGLSPRFLQYVLIAGTSNLRAAGNGSTFPEVSTDALSSLEIPDVPPNNQWRIADFLDDRVGRIDQIVSARLSQIDLMLEADRAVVDKHLGSNHGERMTRLGRIANVQTGLTVDAGRVADGTEVTRPYLRVANVQADRVDLSELKELTVPIQVAARSTLRVGDVLMTEGGDLDKLGRGTIWNGEVDPCLHQNHVFAVRTNPLSLAPEFLALYTRTSDARRHFESTGSRSTNLASTSSAKVLDLRVPFRSLGEQQEAVRAYQEESSRVAAGARAIAEQIELLREYKQSLITAAVTGELDVTTAGSRIPG